MYLPFMTQFQPAKRTPVTDQQMFDALVLAIAKRKDKIPQVDCVLLLVAHWAFETGHGQFMYNFNIGNAKSFPGNKVHDWTFYRCNEILLVNEAVRLSGDPRVELGAFEGPDHRVVWFNPDHPGCCFGSWPDLQSGVDAYANLIIDHFTDESHPETNAWGFAEAGDAAGYCHALKLKRYYTDSEAHYTNSVTNIFNTLKNKNLDTSVIARAQALIDAPPTLPAPAPIPMDLVGDQNLIMDGERQNKDDPTD